VLSIGPFLKRPCVKPSFDTCERCTVCSSQLPNSRCIRFEDRRTIDLEAIFSCCHNGYGLPARVDPRLSITATTRRHRRNSSSRSRLQVQIRDLMHQSMHLVLRPNLFADDKLFNNRSPCRLRSTFLSEHRSSGSASCGIAKYPSIAKRFVFRNFVRSIRVTAWASIAADP